MREASKAYLRREADATFPWNQVFQGIGIDVGASDDPYPNAIPFNIPDGKGDLLTAFFSPQFKVNYVHSSHCAEHAIDPVAMVASWLEMLMPGGHIIFTCPDFRTYEGLRFPSVHNAGHRSTWSMDIESSPAPIHCKMPEWLHHFDADVLRCKLILENYDPTLDPVTHDQTFDFEKRTECCIETVMRKR